MAMLSFGAATRERMRRGEVAEREIWLRNQCDCKGAKKEEESLERIDTKIVASSLKATAAIEELKTRKREKKKRVTGAVNRGMVGVSQWY